jgi:BirA family biotin operon repressor/biotin-[acetyl-CoA-carboxylase] ligase
MHFDYEHLADRIAERGIAIGRPLELLDEIDSTNDAAKRAAKLGAPHGALFVAESQSRGRGRQGRAWLGVRGESILASVVLRLPVTPHRLPPLALVAGLAARDAIAAATGAPAAIKWPNDVLVEDRGAERSEPSRGGARGAQPLERTWRKVAGVLVEAVVSGRSVEAVIVGVGVNVHQRSFPAEIAERATSVALHARSAPDRAAILVDLLAGLDRDAAHVAARGLGLVHARLVAADALAGREVDVEGVRGEACGIDLDGALRVRAPDGAVRRVVAGEVTT